MRARLAIALALALALGLGLAVPSAAPAVQAAEDPAADAAAVQAYRAGDLQTARALWLELLEAAPPPVAGRARGRVLYNLGNVAARQERWLEAVGWYTAAQRLRPRDEDLWANLELARLRAELPPADRGDLLDTLRRLVSSLTPAEAQWLALAGLVPLAVALCFEALRGGALWRRLALGALLLAATLAAPFAWSLARAGSDPVLVVHERGAAVRSEPRGDAASIERADPGARLERLDALPGWVKVRLASGAKGWARADDVFALAR